MNYDATQASPNVKPRLQALRWRRFHPAKCDRLNRLACRTTTLPRAPIVLRLSTKPPAQLPKQLALATTQQHPTPLYPQQQWPNQASVTKHPPQHCFFPAHARLQNQIATRSPKCELACETGLVTFAGTASLHGHFLQRNACQANNVSTVLTH